jgi:hypothetical protein
VEREPATRGTVALHVRRAIRPGSEFARLLNDLNGICWPGGHEDRTELLARGRLSLRGPELVVAETPVCRCADGACQICN